MRSGTHGARPRAIRRDDHCHYRPRNPEQLLGNDPRTPGHRHLSAGFGNHLRTACHRGPVGFERTDPFHHRPGTLQGSAPDSRSQCRSGKGQRGNTWEADKGKNLLFSFVLYPTFLEARRQFILSQIVSLSIKEELDRWSDEITIKWPNDIYWRDKKICGILIENDLSGHFIGRSISGIGININQDEFHSDAPNPVSLKQITGQEHDRYEILSHILKRVQIYYNGLQTEDGSTYTAEIAARYARSLFRRRGFHPYEDADGRFSARLLRVEQDGRFVLEDENGKEREYLFKEVQYIV